MSHRNALRQHITGIPVDALIVFFISAFAIAGVFVFPASSIVRVVFGFPLLFFLPGYAVLALLFPRGVTTTDLVSWRSNGLDSRGTILSPQDRIALSTGISIALIPILSLCVWVLPLPETPEVLVTILGSIIGIGMGRLLFIPKNERYQSPFYIALLAVQDKITPPLSFRQRTSNIILLLLISLALIGLVGTVVAPPQTESYSDLSVLTENESGELVASGYPENLSTNGSRPIVVRIKNQENARTTYTLVTSIEQYRRTNQSLDIQERRVIERKQVSLDDGATASIRPNATTQIAGPNQRVVFLLYRGNSPSNPNTKNAYRYAYIWLNTNIDE